MTTRRLVNADKLGPSARIEHAPLVFNTGAPLRRTKSPFILFDFLTEKVNFKCIETVYLV